MKEIPLTQGKVTKVDDEDFEELNKYNWCYSNTYATRRASVADGGSKQPHIYIHKILCPCGPSKVVIHLDGDRLNNQRSNLKAVTRAWIHQQGDSKNSTGFKGVSKRHDCWSASICHKGKSVYLGRFKSAEDAARKYDEEALKLYGSGARLNFPRAAS